MLLRFSSLSSKSDQRVDLVILYLDARLLSISVASFLFASQPSTERSATSVEGERYRTSLLLLSRQTVFFFLTISATIVKVDVYMGCKDRGLRVYVHLVYINVLLGR